MASMTVSPAGGPFEGTMRLNGRMLAAAGIGVNETWGLHEGLEPGRPRADWLDSACPLNPSPSDPAFPQLNRSLRGTCTMLERGRSAMIPDSAVAASRPVRSPRSAHPTVVCESDR